jgi:UDP-GlcNAc:undecaprenyl-phosphate GlcNAc-1-phosphate transferase
MKSFVLAFAIAALTSAALVPIVRKLALGLGAVSLPGGRHKHHKATPRLGGIAIFLAFFAPLLTLLFVESSVAKVYRAQEVRCIGLLVGGAALCALGALDDTKRVRALHKLLVQIAAAVGAYACGFRIELVKLPMLGDLSMGIFSLPVTILWIVGIVNAINLIDGLDGLAAGVVFFAGLTNFCVAYLAGSVMVALLMAAMLGAVLGFLFYNFNPARIFMGDSGSYFLGFVIATTSLLGSMQRASTAISLLVPILALGVPIFDTLFTMVRRFLERRPIFSPDRGHLHHRLVDMGITHRRAVLILYGTSIVFTLTAIVVSMGKMWQGGVALLVATVVLVGVVRFAGYFSYLHGLRRQKGRFRTRDVEVMRRLMPALPGMLSGAKNEDELWERVQRLLEAADLVAIEVLVPADGQEPRHAWSRKERPPEAVSARYPIGRDDNARASLKFVWESDFGDVSPQAEILLQVVVDVVARELRRLESELAPAKLASATESGGLPRVLAETAQPNLER